MSPRNLYSTLLSDIVRLITFRSVPGLSYFLSICLRVSCFMSANFSREMMSTLSFTPFSACHLCWVACALSRSSVSGRATLKRSILEYSFLLNMSEQGTISLLMKGV